MSTECEHPNKIFVRTDENWWDGDETEVYKCPDCGETVKEYIPR